MLVCEEPPTMWSEMPRDTLILVWMKSGKKTTPRFRRFSRFTGGKVYAFAKGQDSSNYTEECAWDEAAPFFD